MQKPFAIAGIQMHVSAVESNIDRMKARLEILMSIYPWVQMVMFSELAAFGPLIKHAQPVPNPRVKEFCELAAKYGIWLLPGSMFEKEGNRIFNTATVINPEGQIVGRYKKMFPFYPYEQGVSPGTEFLVFDVPDVGRFGVSICYDIWFPETTRTLAAMGAEVILHPVLTGSIDRDIELAIARASAAINQCFIFDINGLDAGGNGRSIICGPDGMVQYQADVGEELMPLEIDIERVRRSRELGVLRLGQTLKSFRDRAVDFSVYDRDTPQPYLNSLGSLEKPTRQKSTLPSVKPVTTFT